MKAADLNILGGLFGDFQQGVNFGRGIQNDNQRRRLAEQENARQERQLRMQMAQAQVAAEKARQDMQYKPKEFDLDVAKHETAKGRLDLDVKNLDWNKEKADREDKSKTVQFNRDQLLNMARGLTTADARGKLASKPMEYWLDDPQGQQEFLKLADDDARKSSGREISTAAGKADVQNRSLTNYMFIRDEVKGVPLDKDTDRLVKTMHEFDAKALDPANYSSGEAAEQTYTQLKQKYLSKIQLAEEATNPLIKARRSSEAATLRQILEARDASKRGAQYQQAIGPVNNIEAPPPARIAQPDGYGYSQQEVEAARQELNKMSEKEKANLKKKLLDAESTQDLSS